MTTRLDAAIARAEAIAQIVPTDPRRWTDLVAALRDGFDSRGAVLFTPEPPAGLPPWTIVDGAMVEGAPAYARHWIYEDAWNRAVDGTEFYQRAGDVEFGDAFIAERNLRRTAFFNDWGRHYEAEQLVSVKLTDRRSRGVPVLHLTLLRRFVDPRYTEVDRAALRRLWPHLNRAAAAAWALRPVTDAHGAIENTLDLRENATWAVRENGKIEFANRAACALMQAGVWARDYQGALVRVGQLDGPELRQRIAHGAQRVAMDLVFAVEGRWLRPGTMHLVPISEGPLYVAAWPRARTLLSLEIPGPASSDMDAWMGHLAAHYGLTPTQCEVLKALAQGMTPKEIAEMRGVEVGTIKAHLTALRERTKLTRQIDLVRLVIGR